MNLVLFFYFKNWIQNWVAESIQAEIKSFENNAFEKSDYNRLLTGG